MAEGGAGPTYRDELAAAYERIAMLERRNRELDLAIGRRDEERAALEQLRDMDAMLRRWDRVRATLAMALGLTGLFALRIAERFSVRVALLAACAAMVVVGVTLAWPKTVRGRVDPKPHALDVSRPWRRGRKKRAKTARAEPSVAGAVRVDVAGRAHDAPATADEHAEPAFAAKRGRSSL